MKQIILSAVFSLMSVSIAAAAVQEKKVEYKQGDQTLVGYVVSDDAVKGNAPGVIVFSDWMGVGQFAKDRANELAKLGYRAFVADIYGDGHQAKDFDEAGKLATKFKSDRPLMRLRTQAALDTFKKSAAVDPNKIAAIGFCFGGTNALELARTGAPIIGVVSFHGGLGTPDTELAKNIKGKILALHGADDTFVPPAEVKAFEDEMNGGNVDWQLVKYSHQVHAFTNPAAGSDHSKGMAYDELTAKRAYQAMRDFLKEVFGG